MLSLMEFSGKLKAEENTVTAGMQRMKAMHEANSHPPALLIKPNHHAHRRPQGEHQLRDEGVNLSGSCPG